MQLAVDHFESCQTTLVLKEIETSWRRRSCVLLSGCCPTNLGVCYACPAWHTSITKEQTKSLEDIQRRAHQVIIGNIP